MDTQGVWSNPLMAEVAAPLEKPTRITRLQDFESKGLLAQALNEVLKDRRRGLPVWVLLPRDWVHRFEISRPAINPLSAARAHLIWEVRQFIHGDPTLYRIFVPKDTWGEILTVYAVRKEILGAVESALAGTGAVVTGVGVEPAVGALYSLDSMPDLREAVAADQPTSEAKSSAFNPLPVAAAAVGVAVVAAVVFLLWSRPERNQLRSTPDAPAASVTAPTPSAEATHSPAATPASSLSPVTTFIQRLPAGAQVTLASLSPVEFRAEVLGLPDPEAWLQVARTSPGLADLSAAGTFNTPAGAVAVFTLHNPAGMSSEGPRQVDTWAEMARKAGMTPEGRTAVGPLSSALTLLDATWNNPVGFSKFYLMSEQNRWRVTVQ